MTSDPAFLRLQEQKVSEEEASCWKTHTRHCAGDTHVKYPLSSEAPCEKPTVRTSTGRQDSG